MCCTWKQMLCEDSLFLDRVITIIETLAYHHNPATKCWKTLSSLPPKKIRQTKLATKVLLRVFFEKDSILYIGMLFHCTQQLSQIPTSRFTTITTDAYIRIRKSLCQHLWSIGSQRVQGVATSAP